MNNIDNVDWFANRMKERLREKESEKHGWSGINDLWLAAKLMEEIGEIGPLLCESHYLDGEPILESKEFISERLISEAIDIANLAFMLADNAALEAHDDRPD